MKLICCNRIESNLSTSNSHSKPAKAVGIFTHYYLFSSNGWLHS